MLAHFYSLARDKDSSSNNNDNGSPRNGRKPQPVQKHGLIGTDSDLLLMALASGVVASPGSGVVRGVDPRQHDLTVRREIDRSKVWSSFDHTIFIPLVAYFLLLIQMTYTESLLFAPYLMDYLACLSQYLYATPLLFLFFFLFLLHLGASTQTAHGHLLFWLQICSSPPQSTSRRK